jgi:hypothetical protein
VKGENIFSTLKPSLKAIARCLLLAVFIPAIFLCPVALIPRAPTDVHLISKIVLLALSPPHFDFRPKAALSPIGMIVVKTGAEI